MSDNNENDNDGGVRDSLTRRELSKRARSERAGPTSRSEWEALASNPDPEEDLGYAVHDWEEYQTADGNEQLIYLPSDESLIEDAAYLVVDEAILCDLARHY